MRRRWPGLVVPLGLIAMLPLLAALVGRAIGCLEGDALYAVAGLVCAPVVAASPIYWRLLGARWLNLCTGAAFLLFGWIVFFAGVQMYVGRCLLSL